jgi:hypothetical protein
MKRSVKAPSPSRPPRPSSSSQDHYASSAQGYSQHSYVDPAEVRVSYTVTGITDNDAEDMARQLEESGNRYKAEVSRYETRNKRTPLSMSIGSMIEERLP